MSVGEQMEYSRLTTSPVTISLAAAAVRSCVRRFNRPSCHERQQRVLNRPRILHTSSSLPQNHAAPAGAPGIAGSSQRRGSFSALGSNSILSSQLVSSVRWPRQSNLQKLGRKPSSMPRVILGGPQSQCSKPGSQEPRRRVGCICEAGVSGEW
jgi:hypothetical protein